MRGRRRVLDNGGLSGRGNSGGIGGASALLFGAAWGGRERFPNESGRGDGPLATRVLWGVRGTTANRVVGGGVAQDVARRGG